MVTTLLICVVLGAQDAPLPREALVIRGRGDHPCVTRTAADVNAARQRIEKYAWAREEYESILAEADAWLR